MLAEEPHIWHLIHKWFPWHTALRGWLQLDGCFPHSPNLLKQTKTLYWALSLHSTTCSNLRHHGKHFIFVGSWHYSVRSVTGFFGHIVYRLEVWLINWFIISWCWNLDIWHIIIILLQLISVQFCVYWQTFQVFWEIFSDILVYYYPNSHPTPPRPSQPCLWNNMSLKVSSFDFPVFPTFQASQLCTNHNILLCWSPK